MAEVGREVSAEEKAQLMGQVLEGTAKESNSELPKETQVEKETVKPTEPKAETKEEPKVEKPVDKPDPVSMFSQWSGKEFKSEEEIKAFIEKADQYDGLKTSSEELNQKLSEYKKIAEGVNPLSYFVNEDEYIRQQFLKNNKDKLSSEAIDALSSLTPEKVKKLDGASALITDLVVNSGLTREEAQAYVNSEYGIEEGEELDISTKAKMKISVNEAKSRLSKMYDGITIPEQTDWEATRGQLKESWSKPLQAAIEGLDKIEIAEGIDFVVDQSMREGLEQEIMAELLVSGVKPSEEALANAVGNARSRILERNMDKVVKSIESDLREKIKSELRADIHNDRPLNDATKPTNKSVDRDTQILNAW